MRIYGANGMTGSVAAGAARRAKPGAFALPQISTEQSTTQPSNVHNVAGIDAWLALQGVDDPA